jgi:hypothetical protein
MVINEHGEKEDKQEQKPQKLELFIRPVAK